MVLLIRKMVIHQLIMTLIATVMMIISMTARTNKKN